MKAVEELTKMAQWKENPLRPSVLLEVSRILVNETRELAVSAAVKRSLIGDRVELFLLLSQQDPEAAARVMNRVKGKPEESYYRFAMGFYGGGKLRLSN